MRVLSLVAAALVSAPALAADVGVSISVGEPGFYGRLDIGNAPRPLLIYPEPIVIVKPHTVTHPIYMRVPPGHAKNWRAHCASYGACGRPVYFVQDGWYEEVYVPHHKKHHANKGGGKGKGHGKGNKG